MNIVLYDLDKYDLEDIDSIYRYMKEKIDMSNWMFLPKDFTALLDCSTAELYAIRERINDAIRDKEIIEEV